MGRSAWSEDWALKRIKRKALEFLRRNFDDLDKEENSNRVRVAVEVLKRCRRVEDEGDDEKMIEDARRAMGGTNGEA